MVFIATDSLSLRKLPRIYHILPNVTAIFTHILPFYNKGVCQRPNVDDKIEVFLLFLKKLVQDGDSELRMQNTGDRIQEKNKAKVKRKHPCFAENRDSKNQRIRNFLTTKA